MRFRTIQRLQRRGDTVRIDAMPGEPRFAFSPEDQRRLRTIVDKDRDALRYLADH